ncbi:hypothetical protein EJ03DRAFT_13081 [Teratosphaeria nubilosa]|uniref:Uncharacterized protein n=1 Tax=Teratosphaeria nubilosa TaxID=161662 RepID=A0A6G1KX33_9PEZI|nr:hypothetical protein EJ03DRAFT_13081 [Teratosphaeria nubilosa]
MLRISAFQHTLLLQRACSAPALDHRQFPACLCGLVRCATIQLDYLAYIANLAGDRLVAEAIKSPQRLEFSKIETQLHNVEL